MIKLTDLSGKPNRIIQGVQFVDGKAEIPDILKPKAEAMSKFYNIEVELTFEPESSNVVLGDGLASDIAIDPSPVGPESVEVEDVVVEDVVVEEKPETVWATPKTGKAKK